jgi:hypothetical protein
VLSTSLTDLFASRVAPAVPPAMALLVYGSALLVAAGGFVLLFLCDAGDGHGAAGLGTCAKSRNGDAVGPDMGAAGWGLQAGASRTVPVTLFRQFLIPSSYYPFQYQAQ